MTFLKSLIEFIESTETEQIELVQINFNVPVILDSLNINLIEVKYSLKSSKDIDSSYFTESHFKELTKGDVQ